MLKSIRVRLTLLYLFAAIGLIGLISASAYLLMRYNFQQTTDQALQYRMAAEFKKYELPLPADLKLILHQWIKHNTSSSPIIKSTPLPTREPVLQDNAQLQTLPLQSESDELSDEEFDGELSAVFVTTHSSNEQSNQSLSQAPAPIAEDKSATKNALQYGVDWRTVRLSNGSRARLLTYRTSTNGLAPDVLQVGRLLDDQDRLLKQYLIGLMILGGVISIFLALVSWWLAGRSLSPAQKAWDQQQLFIANASHELRTPLTLLRATADYGVRSQPDENQKNVLQDIIDECDYMNHLVDDLLLLSRLDAKQLKLELEPILLSELLNEISHQIEPLFQDKNISLSIGSPHGIVFGDRIRLRQVLLILLDNALRYTPPGGMIRIQTHSQKRSLDVSITDYGQGIPTQHLPHLFERFYQVQQSKTDNTHQNGLGLSIAKTLIEAQKGTIQIKSVVGKGTRVTLSLPAA